MNMSLEANYDPADGYSDLWGYELGGNQYAIITQEDNIYIVDVSSCNSPVVKTTLAMPTSNGWRDAKTYNDHLYVVTEGNEGLRVYDLSGVASGTVSFVTSITTEFTRAHNIFIDQTAGMLYACGANVSGDPNKESLVIYDLSTPASPSLSASPKLDDIASAPTDDYYVHDLYVDNGVAYCSHGNLGEIIIWDVSAPSAPTITGRYSSGNYNHSNWPGTGGMLYYAEEIPAGLSWGVIDINTPSSPSLVATFGHSIETTGSSTPHNPYFHNNKLYLSNYADGVKIYDVSSPSSPAIYGYYDTYTDNDGSGYPSPYSGCWGIYPYLSNGCIIASDGKYGLYALSEGASPVTWNRIDARMLDRSKAKVEWSTSSETNNDYFEVMKSLDGVSFLSIGKVDGTGFSTDVITYSFVDRSLDGKKSYYRIKQVDFDGSFDYSEIRVVSPSSDDEYAVFPNPITSSFTLSFKSSVANDFLIRLYDTSGKMVLSTSVVSSKEDLLFTRDPSWVSGSYFLESSKNGIPFYAKNVIIE